MIKVLFNDLKWNSFDDQR